MTRHHTSLRVAFAGTPDFAVPSLQSLLDTKQCDVVAIYTQPDKPAGRGRKTRPSAVKAVALDNGIEVRQPLSFRDEQTRRDFAALNVDVFVVAAYGLLLPQAVLDSVDYPINVHASLLPRWRGAAPIQRAIMAGDEMTGITIMRLVKALDAGPIWLQRRCAIGAECTGGELHDQLAALGAECLAQAIERIADDKVEEIPQDDSLAVYAPKIDNQQRRLDFTADAVTLERIIRALNPAPVAIATFAGQDFKVWRATAQTGPSGIAPGSLVAADRQGIRIATANGVLCIHEIQPPGKQRMDVAAFLNGAGAKIFRPTGIGP